jgi:hypothetical protein
MTLRILEANARYRTAVRRFAAAFALTFAFIAPSLANAAPWLFVSDVHLDPLSTSAAPPWRGSDTNETLLRSAIAEMQRVDPAPPVVVIPGDFLGHNFNRSYANSTIAHIAQLFGDAFPKAQFVLALGNEDSACGDYVLAPNSPFLTETAAVWEPLVNRHGQAPDFLKTFPRDGFYTTKLPVPGLRAVVIDDSFWSPRYRFGCGSPGADGGAEELADLDRALPPGNREKSWVLLHIPPGIDAFSTVHLTHHLAVVPFLETAPRERLLAILRDKRRNVVLGISGHTHKFAFRLVDADGPDPVPILLVPSLSPIFKNNPMFLTADVGPDGTIRTIEEYAYDYGVWRDVGGSRDLGLNRISGPALAALDHRLEVDPALRTTFARLYDGGAPPEISASNWLGYACAIDSMNASDYRRCEGRRGYRFMTLRGLAAITAVAATVLLLVFLLVLFVRRRVVR